MLKKGKGGKSLRSIAPSDPSELGFKSQIQFPFIQRHGMHDRCPSHSTHIEILNQNGPGLLRKQPAGLSFSSKPKKP